MKKLCITILLSVLSVWAQATQTDKAIGKWLVVDQTNEMGERHQALVLVGVVVGGGMDKDGAIMTLQKNEKGGWFFGIALTVPANDERSINIRFDQADAQPHYWRRAR